MSWRSVSSSVLVVAAAWARAPIITWRSVGAARHSLCRRSFTKPARLEKKGANIFTLPRDQETTNRYNEIDGLTVSALPRFAFFIFIRVCFLQPRLYLEWPQGDLRNSTHVLV